MQDLEADFEHPDRPALVTRVLAACAAEFQRPDEIWRLSVSERIGAVLRIVMLTDRRTELELHLRCPACGAGLEVELPYADLLAAADRARQEPQRTVDWGERRLTLRRPTGEDQRTWRAQPARATAEWAAAMAATLVMEEPDAPQLLPADVARLSEAMEEFDPLVAFEVATQCPACGSDAAVPVDLQSAALDRLQAQQRRLLSDVHRLATGYGWTEQQALAVPSWRREEYLHLLDRDAGLP